MRSGTYVVQTHSSQVTTHAALAGSANRAFAVGLARAFAGALLFSLPILMTMETWSLGFSIERLRLILLLLVMLPILVGLSYYSGFEATTSVLDAAVDAFVAIAVAAVMAIVFLWLFGVLTRQMSVTEWIGKIALQTVPGQRGEEELARREAGDAGEYFLMVAGALFLAANIAPTEEVARIAFMMSPWQSIVLALISLVLMHGFVYAVDFRGQHVRPEHVPLWSAFVRFSVVGYAMALLISAYLCWTFGRFDGLDASEIVAISVVLGFPAAIGAASARLVL
jgi:putative integral membrane protein (TIGR02587 family)